MRVKARVIAGQISITPYHIGTPQVLTADLHLAPQLRLALLALLLLAGLWSAHRGLSSSFALGGDLAGVNEAIRLDAGALGIIFRRVRYAWWC